MSKNTKIELFKNSEKIPFILLIIVTAMFRFWGLGYSDFYGDETKTFYLDKTVPASEFFLNQRKGPVQFFVVWASEKIIGGYDEFWTRVPFALAGTLAVVMLYLVVRELFNWKTGIISAFLFSLGGFYLAFSRTIQYQSLLLFLGLTGLYFFIVYSKNENKSRLSIPLILSSLFYAFALLTHYDAIVFFIPAAYIFIKDRTKWAEIIVSFVIPILVIVSLFYLPYIRSGYFEQNSINYISRRVTGKDFELNNSLYTYYMYNPFLLSLIVLILPFYILFMDKIDKNIKIILFWFLSTFLVYELFISNPGTHILLYYIPLLIATGYVISLIASYLNKIAGKNVALYTLGVLLTGFVIRQMFVYIPLFSTGYPWNSNLGGKYHLYLYGFPYNGGWRQVRDYFKDKNRIKGIYTNDNDTIAQYYLRGIHYTQPGANFLPHYYVHVYQPQEFIFTQEKFNNRYTENYTKEKDIYDKRGTLISTIYVVNGDTTTEW